MSILVAQLGARMHYAVPRIFAKANLLDGLYTDICSIKGWPRLIGALPRGLRSAKFRSLLARTPEGIPENQITAFTNFGLSYFRRLNRAKTDDERTAAYLWAGTEFCKRILARGLGKAQAVYAFNSAALELLEEARRKKVKSIVEQTIAPKAVEWRLLEEEHQRFPDWEKRVDNKILDQYCDRELKEWSQADLVICGSEFVRQGVITCGTAAEKCAVVPYGVDLQTGTRPSSPASRPRRLRVLTVGAVGLRKGTPHVLAAAQRTKGMAEFRLVGKIHVLPWAEKKLRNNLDLLGSVPRSSIREHYAWADVFLLPSVCEGSATATYEARAQGLPVICTRATGSVVRNGKDGFIISHGNTEELVEKLETLAKDPDLLAWMSRNASEEAANYTLEKYAERLFFTLRSRGILEGQ